VLPFDTELSTNYEIGLKGALFDGRMNLNLAAYRVDITDQQIKVRRVNSVTDLANEVLNIGESHTMGLEFETTAIITDALTMGLSLGWVADAQFDELDTSPTSAANATVDLSLLEDLRFPMVPEVTASASFTYEQPLSDRLDLRIFGDYVYVDERVNNFSSDPTLALVASTLDSYQVANLSASLIKGPWTFTAFVRNIFDEEAILITDMQSFVATEVHSSVLEPQRYGLIISHEF